MIGLSMKKRSPGEVRSVLLIKEVAGSLTPVCLSGWPDLPLPQHDRPPAPR